MSLILSEVGSLLVAAVVWLAIVVALAAAVGFTVPTVTGGARGRALRAAVIGGLLSAGISSRLGLSDPAGFEVWGRPLPPLWVLGGAVAAAGAFGWRRNRISRRGEGSGASPAPGAARR